MKAKIGKEFRWEMSHRLPFHKGLCKNIHGHSYKMIVEVEGETDTNGMLMDYYEIEKITEPLIQQLDHSFICDSEDKVMLEFLRKNNFRHVVIPVNTTAENIAGYLLSQIKPKFMEYKNITLIRIRFFETGDAFAEVEEELLS